MEAGTSRSRAKEERRSELLAAAIRLFAEHGFTDTSLEQIGSAAGVSGPAVYRHFGSKQAMLAAILLGISDELLLGGQEVVAHGLSPHETLIALVEGHVAFAVRSAEIIRIQDHDLDKLPASERHALRTAQRRYVEIWVTVLAEIHPGEPAASLRTRAHAAFGLMNSTPFSAGRGPRTRLIIASMTLAALHAPVS